MITGEQRAETNTFALRIRKTPDEEILRQLAFHFKPLLRTAVLVNRTASLRDDSFPTFSLRAFPW